MEKILIGFCQISQPEKMCCWASPERPQLWKNKPHPVALFSPALQFFEGASPSIRLSVRETIQAIYLLRVYDY
jgi:hypothetical protein